MQEEVEEVSKMGASHRVILVQAWSDDRRRSPPEVAEEAGEATRVVLGGGMLGERTRALYRPLCRRKSEKTGCFGTLKWRKRMEML